MCSLSFSAFRVINTCSCFCVSKHMYIVFIVWHLPLFHTDFNSFDKSSVDEEVAPLEDGPVDDDILPNTSDEEGEDDSSSNSSKGVPEQPDESTVRS